MAIQHLLEIYGTIPRSKNQERSPPHPIGNIITTGNHHHHNIYLRQSFSVWFVGGTT